MKNVALAIAAGSVALSSAAEARTIVGIYDSRGGCQSALHQAVGDEWRFYNGHSGRPEGWQAGYVCSYYNGYYYLVRLDGS